MPNLRTPTEALAENQTLCASCSTPHPTSYMLRARTSEGTVETLCDDCARYCDNCGSAMRARDARTGARLRFCYRCEGRYGHCEDCGCVFDTSELNSDGECERCAYGDVIRSYSARPNLTPIGDPPHYLGVELEVEVNDGHTPAERAARVLRALPDQFAITKSDGSLDNGFEICTRPASLEKQREAWKAFFDARLTGIVSHSTATCGLHVHCSKAPLSDLDVAKIVCFVNHSANQRFIHTIAGRYSNGFCALKKKQIRTAGRPTGDKYEAVNLCHANTIEFRIFKGTLKRESFFKALEFCDALIAFQRFGYTLRRSLDHRAFCYYVSKNAARWPLLDAFISCRWKGQAPSNRALQYWSLINNARPPLPPPQVD